jgi:inorganic phosphate transporter, PiT family
VSAFLAIVLACALAYANGANDVSRGVATLVGSGLAGYRRALLWGTIWTVAGALAATAVSAGLALTFSTRLVDGAVATAPAFPLAVAGGACGWVLLAARTGLPVSTTHSLTGAIVGTAIAAGGMAGIQWPLLVGIVVVPLAFSPLCSATMSYATHALLARPLAWSSKYCVCAGERPLLLITKIDGGVATATGASLPTVVAGHENSCAPAALPAQIRITDAAHWGTSAMLSFARGLNDNPKIIALATLPLAGSALTVPVLLVMGGLAMGLGSFLYGRRVTRTMAERITHIDALEGLSASAVASVLVLLASAFALPVSTTHVSTGAIVGAGLRGGVTGIDWRVLGGLILAWLVTLPVSGLLGAALWRLLAW